MPTKTKEKKAKRKKAAGVQYPFGMAPSLATAVGLGMGDQYVAQQLEPFRMARAQREDPQYEDEDLRDHG